MSVIDGTNKVVVTRKGHRCAGCYRKFPAGTKLTKIDFLNRADNTGFCTWYICPVCEWFVENGDCADYDGMYYEGFAIESDKDLFESKRKEIEGAI